MAKKFSAAQHFIVCYVCKNQPAQFICKTCPGHLCDTCASEHERNTMSKHHDMIFPVTDNEQTLAFLFCSSHTKKKLECYCEPCKKPVCTICIVETHYGHHPFKDLSKVFEDVRKHNQILKNNIENSMLPKYKDLIANADAKRSAIKSTAREVEKKIDNYTMSVKNMVENIVAQHVQNLRDAEIEALKGIDTFKSSIEAKVKELQQMSDIISSNLESKPHVSLFCPINDEDLHKFKSLPKESSFKLNEFCPEEMNKNIEKELPRIAKTT